MKSKKYILITTIIFFLTFPLGNVFAHPFLDKGSGSSFTETVSNATQSVNSLAPATGFIFNALFTIMFLFGIVRLGYSLVTKTGQVMKGATGILIWVPITVMFIRLFIIFIFTTNENNVTLFASEIINLLRASGYLLSLGMILVGLVFYLFYNLIKHPEFGRWSKRLWATSAILVLLTTVMPHLLGAA